MISMAAHHYPGSTKDLSARLGDGLAQSCSIGADGFRQSRGCSRFRAIADASKVTHLDDIATDTVRRAANVKDLVAVRAGGDDAPNCRDWSRPDFGRVDSSQCADPRYRAGLPIT
jgi:hypothetical protein